ncbi:hypothetical protein ACFX1X_028406 [Malus domestica]
MPQPILKPRELQRLNSGILSSFDGGLLAKMADSKVGKNLDCLGTNCSCSLASCGLSSCCHGCVLLLLLPLRRRPELEELQGTAELGA